MSNSDSVKKSFPRFSRKSLSLQLPEMIELLQQISDSCQINFQIISILKDGSKFPLIKPGGESEKTIYLGHSLYPTPSKEVCHIFFPIIRRKSTEKLFPSAPSKLEEYLELLKSCDNDNPGSFLPLCGQLGVVLTENVLTSENVTKPGHEIRDNLNRLITQGTTLPSGSYKQKAELLNEKVEEFRGHWQTTQDLTKRLLNGKYLPTIQSSLGDNQMIDHLKKFMIAHCKTEYRILVVGDTSSGKSTMINAFLGIKLLPSEPSECTAMFTEIAFGDGYELLFYNDTDELQVYQKFDNLVQLVEELNRTVPVDRCSTYYRVRVQAPFGILESGLVIVDSPGVQSSNNSRNDWNTSRIRTYSETCLGIIWLLNAERGANQSFWLGKLLQGISNSDLFNAEGDVEFKNNIFQHVRNSLFVLNKFDLLCSSEPTDKVQETINKIYRFICVHWSPFFEREYLLESNAGAYLKFIQQESNPSIHLAQDCDAFYNRVHSFISDCLIRRLHQIQVILKSATEFLLNTHEATQFQITRSSENNKILLKRIEQARREFDAKMTEFQDEIRTPTAERSKRIQEAAKENMNDKLVEPTVTRILSGTPQNPSQLETLIRREVAFSFERFLRWYAKFHNSDSPELEIGNRIFGDLKKELFDLRAIIGTRSKGGISFLVPAVLIGVGVAGAAGAGLMIACAIAIPPFGFGIVTAVTSAIVVPTACVLAGIAAVKVGLVLKQWSSFQIEHKEEFLRKKVTKLMEKTLSQYEDSHIEKSVKAMSSVFEPMKDEFNLMLKTLKNSQSKDKESAQFPSTEISELRTILGTLNWIELSFILPDKIPSSMLTLLDEPQTDSGDDDEPQTQADQEIATTELLYTVRKGLYKGKIVSIKRLGPKGVIQMSTIGDYSTILSNVIADMKLIKEMPQRECFLGYLSYSLKKIEESNVQLDVVSEDGIPFISWKNQLRDSHSNQYRHREYFEFHFAQILSTLAFLHDQFVVHRNVYIHNVLITEGNVACLSGFGICQLETDQLKILSRVQQDTDSQMEDRIELQAPEVKSFGYGTKADVYGFGIVAWEIWHGERIDQKFLLPNVPLFEGVAPPKPFEQIIAQCLLEDPQQRPSFADIKTQISEHALFTSI